MCILGSYINVCLNPCNHHSPNYLLLCCCYACVVRWEHVASLTYYWQERYVVCHWKWKTLDRNYYTNYLSHHHLIRLVPNITLYSLAVVCTDVDTIQC